MIQWLESDRSEIKLSEGDMLGKRIRTFNLPNDNCGIIRYEGNTYICKKGGGKNAEKEKCLDCEII
ncbi:MAG: hypothetical protein PHX08_05335 [Lachnospiraceae bacterium]|nr:hypothetical protein [Lachnospiraceae bacterium]